MYLHNILVGSWVKVGKILLPEEMKHPHLSIYNWKYLLHFACLNSAQDYWSDISIRYFLLDKYILHSLMVKYSWGINKKTRFFLSLQLI